MKTTATLPTTSRALFARSATWPTRPADGEEGLGLALEREYDVLIVDRMLPKRDGLSLIGELRHKDVHTPILIFSPPSARLTTG